MSCKPSTDSSCNAKPMERSICAARKPRDRRKPVRYAVDGYGVFSCVIGGMIDRIRSADVVSVVMLVSDAIERTLLVSLSYRTLAPRTLIIPATCGQR